VEILYVSSKKGFFQLSHLDAEHKDNFRPEANLSLLDDPKTPAMPPMVTTKEPDAKEEDEDEMVFIAAWCCVASEDLDEDDSVGSMSILKGREDYDSSDDEEDDFVSSKSPRITKDTGNYLLALLQYLAL
jgi:hypothetical protein